MIYLSEQQIGDDITMKQCNFCAKEISYNDMYCCKECEDSYNAFFSTRAKMQKLLSLFNILGTCLIGVGIFVVALQNFVGLLMIGIGGVAVGGITLLLPTPTDNMIKKHKLNKAVKTVRIFGIILVAFGIAALVLAFFNR